MSIKKTKVGIIGGSCLNDPDILKNRRVKQMTETPFGTPSDDLIIGEIYDVPCAILPQRRGRKHNVIPSVHNFRADIWAFYEEGCSHIISICFAGSLQETIKVGDIAICQGFIDFSSKKQQTFFDGQRGHPPGMSLLQTEPSFDEDFRKLICNAAQDIQLKIHKNCTVMVVDGPRFPTQVECDLYRTLGANIFNMYTVPEVILAREIGIIYTSINIIVHSYSYSIVSNVISIYQENIYKLCNLVVAIIKRMADKNWKNSYRAIDGALRYSFAHHKEFEY